MKTIHVKKSHIAGSWFFYVVFCASLALSWFFHKDATRFTDPSELCSDRAGYYIYLPATFFYRFDTRRMPADLDIQTGGGFSIDTLNKKISTKYTYGVALLASPFFLASGLVSRIAGFDSESGFSMLYMRMMSLAAVIYLVLGLWFLKKFLDNYFKPVVNFFVIILVFLGTNLFYYALIDGMMSHVYSFFLFALFLFALKKFRVSQSGTYFLLVSFALSLAILIRPTNILLGLLFFTWDAASPAEWLKRLKLLLKSPYALYFPLILFIVFLPQLIYWKYLSGNWLHFSYGKEGFTNWSHPRIAEVLFSPVNGLLTYTPMVFFFLTGTFMMILRRRSNGWLIAAVFILVTLVCASWNMWYFGCSYGQRSYVEYYTILSVPLAWLVTGVFSNRSLVVKTIVLFLVFFTVYANLRHSAVLYRLDRCYFGSTWDWDHYLRTVERSGVISPVSRINSYQNDFENLALCPVRHPSMIFTHSGEYSIPCDGKSKRTPLYSAGMYEFKYPWPKQMDVDLWILSPGRRSGRTTLSCNTARGDNPVFSDSRDLSAPFAAPLVWTHVSEKFIIPDVNDSSLRINVFIDNPDGALFYVDDLAIRFHYDWDH
ncbi:MAG: hypothetical protein NT040_05595 [Bacteroidetes bacterium]|nr:hypothetical protein [Bacteroidota bacterium]